MPAQLPLFPVAIAATVRCVYHPAHPEAVSVWFYTEDGSPGIEVMFTDHIAALDMCLGVAVEVSNLPTGANVKPLGWNDEVRAKRGRA